jgi:hypothetical protein
VVLAVAVDCLAPKVNLVMLIITGVIILGGMDIITSAEGQVVQLVMLSTDAHW